MKNKESNPQLYELSRHIPADLINPPAPGKYGDYVNHAVITQILLATVGPFSWEIKEILRGDSSGWMKVDGKRQLVEKHNVIVGVVGRLDALVDGTRVWIDEAGDCDTAYMEDTDGARLKKASSDALKRAAMRLGVGIHLWAKTEREFFLPRILNDSGSVEPDGQAAVYGVEDAEPETAEVEGASPVGEDDRAAMMTKLRTLRREIGKDAFQGLLDATADESGGDRIAEAELGGMSDLFLYDVLAMRERTRQ